MILECFIHSMQLKLLLFLIAENSHPHKRINAQAQKAIYTLLFKKLMSPGILESNIRLMLDTFPSIFQFEIYYLTSKTSSDAKNTIYIISLALGELKRKIKWPVKLFTHHIHLLLKPFQEFINSSRISHTPYLSLPLDSCLKLLNSFLSILVSTPAQSFYLSMQILISLSLFFLFGAQNRIQFSIQVNPQSWRYNWL